MYKIMVVFLAFFAVACAGSEVAEPSVPESNLAELCAENGGEWLDEFQECEGISEQACSQLNGTFNECASACRNNPEAEFCTLQCVQVCTFTGDEQ